MTTAHCAATWPKQTAVGVDREVASAPTLCRLEKWADKTTAWRLHEVLVDQFIASFTSASKELVLDFDATDNPLYGQQEDRFFHGYYVVLLFAAVRVLRPAVAVRIVFRGDSGFCRLSLINYCERADVNYIVGLARNARLQGITEFLELAMKDTFGQTGLKQREIGEFVCAAQSWAKERRVITRLEYGQQGGNPRHLRG